MEGGSGKEGEREWGKWMVAEGGSEGREVGVWE